MLAVLNPISSVAKTSLMVEPISSVNFFVSILDGMARYLQTADVTRWLKLKCKATFSNSSKHLMESMQIFSEIPAELGFKSNSDP